MNSSDLEKQLRSLFNALRIDKAKDAPVERSSLISLLQYHQMDIEMPEFYRYIARSLEKLPDSNVREDDFLKIVINPDIDLANATKEEMADAFSILDSDKEGSIDMNKFLELYRKSQNYQALSPDQQKEVLNEIKEAFENSSENGKIIPMEFYSIVKFRG